jgi:predicted NAD-dependent protein-ADP-ribosyltransferase YbiA (DUF1768 family)
MIERQKAKYFEGISYSIAFNNYSNTQDSVICNILKNNLSEGNILPRIIEIGNTLSMYSSYPFKFNGFSILELRESVEKFGLGNKTYNYCSIYQYIIHQKAILFLDVTNEARIRNTAINEELEYLDRGISNYDENVWREYALRMMLNGIKTLAQESTQFREDLKNEKSGVFYAKGADDFWNTKSIVMKIDKMLTPKRGKNMNIYGKILTLCKIDKI